LTIYAFAAARCLGCARPLLLDATFRADVLLAADDWFPEPVRAAALGWIVERGPPRREPRIRPARLAAGAKRAHPRRRGSATANKRQTSRLTRLLRIL
jgi:hypothetical protein